MTPAWDIEVGSERSKEREWFGGRVSVHGYDGVTIPYADSAFELVYSTHVLEHVADERQFLQELRRVANRFQASAWSAVLKMVIRRSLLAFNEFVASRIFTYHVGALCTKGPMLAIS